MATRRRNQISPSRSRALGILLTFLLVLPACDTMTDCPGCNNPNPTDNTRPVITLNFSGALQLPSSLNPLATCSDQEDGSLAVRFTRTNGSDISRSEILSLTEQADITATCVDSEGLEANPVTFSVVPPVYTGIVANEDRIPRLDVGQTAIVENLDDDRYSPTNSNNTRLEIYNVDRTANGNVDIGNMVRQGDVFVFQVSSTGRVTQFRKTQAGRGEYRYYVRRTDDTSSTAFAFTREDVSSGRRATDAVWYSHDDGRHYLIQYSSPSTYKILDVR